MKPRWAIAMVQRGFHFKDKILFCFVALTFYCFYQKILFSSLACFTSVGRLTFCLKISWNSPKMTLKIEAEIHLNPAKTKVPLQTHDDGGVDGPHEGHVDQRQSVRNGRQEYALKQLISLEVSIKLQMQPTIIVAQVVLHQCIVPMGGHNIDWWGRLRSGSFSDPKQLLGLLLAINK